MSVKHKSQDKGKMSEIDELIMKIFDIKKRLGKGAYGIVWKAIDKKTSQIVAVKKIFDAFRNETDAQRTFREIMFLRAFRNHSNIIQLNSIHRAENHMDIYLSFEFMESDLHNVIKRGSILKDVHKRYVMYQLFNATNYIHSGNVIHRDLKPSNILLDSRCRCKIADFGLARSVSQRPQGDGNQTDPIDPALTDYVATRWYRAPELLVASKNYTKGIDLWSLGCILGEMIKGKPLFPGSCTVNQVERIISALPNVTERDVKSIGAGFGSALLNQNSSSNLKLDDLLSGAPDDARALVKSLLVLDPGQRLTAKQALCHRYVEKFRHTSPEPELSSDVIPPFRDDIQLSVQEYRSKLYELISSSERNGYSSVKQLARKREATAQKVDSTTQLKNKSIFTKFQNNEQQSSSVSIKKTDLKDTQKKNEKKNLNVTQTVSCRTFGTQQHQTKINNNKIPNTIINNPALSTTITSTTNINKSLNNKTSEQNLLENNNNLISVNQYYEKTKIPKGKYTKILHDSTIKSSDDIDNNNRTIGSSEIKLGRRGSVDSNTNGMFSTEKRCKNYSNIFGDNKMSGNMMKTTILDCNMFKPNFSTVVENTCASANQNRTKFGHNLDTTKYSRHLSLDDEHDTNYLNNNNNLNGEINLITTNSNSVQNLDIDNRKINQTNNNSHTQNSYNLHKKIFDGNKNLETLTQDEISRDYEKRLKTLEDKIRKHKTDMKTFMIQNPKLKLGNNSSSIDSVKIKKPITIQSEMKLTRNYNNNNRTELHRSKSENGGRNDKITTTTAVKFDYTFSDSDNYKQNRRGNNYGVISATDLFKLRSSEMIL